MMNTDAYSDLPSVELSVEDYLATHAKIGHLAAQGKRVVISVPEGTPYRAYKMAVNRRRVGCLVVQGPGPGSAVVFGAGGGHAARLGEGPGDAVRSGKGEGDAYRMDSGAGNARRAGSGEGNAYRLGTGAGFARRSGSGVGRAGVARPEEAK